MTTIIKANESCHLQEDEFYRTNHYDEVFRIGIPSPILMADRKFNLAAATGFLNPKQRQVGRFKSKISKIRDISCLAYNQDSVQGKLTGAYSSTNPHNVLFFDDFLNGDPLYYSVTYDLEDSQGIPQEKMQHLVNLLTHIPLVLIRPNNRAVQFASVIQPGSSRKQPRNQFKTILPGSILATPWLHWWVNAMVRTSLYFIAPNHPDWRKKIVGPRDEILKYFFTMFDPVEIATVVNEHRWETALEIWNEVKKLLISILSSRGAVTSQVNSPWCNISKNAGDYYSRKRADCCSTIKFFDYIVKNGGWTALLVKNPDPRNYIKQKEIKTKGILEHTWGTLHNRSLTTVHGDRCLPLERFIRNGGLCQQLVKSDTGKDLLQNVSFTDIKERHHEALVRFLEDINHE